jgi:hypothetical protein
VTDVGGPGGVPVIDRAADVGPVPPASQRRHWYANATGCVPLHRPASAVSVSPSRAVPQTVGSSIAVGGTAATAKLVAEPAAFVAVTRTASRAPTSSAVATYVREVAPAMSAQLVPCCRSAPTGKRRSASCRPACRGRSGALGTCMR